jgi:hypothetical protein
MPNDNVQEYCFKHSKWRNHVSCRYCVGVGASEVTLVVYTKSCKIPKMTDQSLWTWKELSIA